MLTGLKIFLFKFKEATTFTSYFLKSQHEQRKFIKNLNILNTCFFFLIHLNLIYKELPLVILNSFESTYLSLI